MEGIRLLFMQMDQNVMSRVRCLPFDLDETYSLLQIAINSTEEKMECLITYSRKKSIFKRLELGNFSK
jgi:hypothetical protein